MNYSTHLYLGTVLYPIIEETWGLPLSKKKFLFGCVKPDVSSLFFRHPHFWKYSRKYFFAKVDRLSAHRIEAEKKNKKFSEELGIALHYAADFFTSAHNVTPNRIQEHIAFENALHDAIVARVTTESLRGRMRFLRELPTLSREAGKHPSLKKEIMRLHRTFVPDLNGVSTDINRIVHATLLVTATVLDAVSRDETLQEAAPRAKTAGRGRKAPTFEPLSARSATV